MSKLLPNFVCTYKELSERIDSVLENNLKVVEWERRKVEDMLVKGGNVGFALKQDSIAVVFVLKPEDVGLKFGKYNIVCNLSGEK